MILNIEAIANEALAAIDSGRQIASFSARNAGFTLDDAYNVTAAMRGTRLARSERVLGRKIGFTNRTIWAEAPGVYAPIWGYMYDRTVHNLADLGGAFSALLISPSRASSRRSYSDFPGRQHEEMDDAALIGCVEWVAHGFELVQSIFPAWKFTPADIVAANGLAWRAADRAALPGAAHAPRNGGAPSRLSTSTSNATAHRWTVAAPAT